MSATTHTITLNNGIRVPWLAFGTGSALHGLNAADSVRAAIDNGITHLDGAQLYNNEDSLGAAIKASSKSRSDLYIVTKLHPQVAPGVTVKQTLETSLKELGLDYVDLFLIHDPSQATKEGRLKELWKEFEDVHKDGLAKSIGVSNFKVEDLKQVLDGATIVPAVNQIELHPYVWKAAEPIVTFGKDHGIITASYSGQTPVARGAGPLDDVLPRIRDRLEKTRGHPVTSGQVLSKWLIQKDVIVVTTSSKVSRIKEFIDTESVPDLTSEEIHEIEEAGGKLHKRIFMHHVFDA